MFWRRAVGVALVAALVAGLLWLNGARTYDDLRAGSGAGTDRVPFRDGAHVLLGASIVNEGGRSVKVLDVRADGDVLARTRATMDPADDAARPGRVPFREFDLEPGDSRYVEGDYRARSCRDYDAGTSVKVDAVKVRYRTLMFERTARLRVHTPVTLVRRGRCSG